MRALLAAVLLLVAAPAAAQKPGAVLEALAGTPATLLDVSLARLEATINETGRTYGFSGSPRVQDGQIIAFVYAEEDSASETRCRTIISELKRAAAVHPETGEPYRPASAWASLFSYPRLDQFKVDPMLGRDGRRNVPHPRHRRRHRRRQGRDVRRHAARPRGHRPS